MDEKLSAKLGFVIDPTAPVERQIAYILTAQDLHGDLWEPWLPSGKDSKAHRSAQKYAEALLLMMSRALYEMSVRKEPGRSPKEEGETTGAIVISETEPAYTLWVTRVFNVMNAKGQYDAIPPRLRKSLSPVIHTAGSRARTSGPRPKLADRRVVIAGDFERRVFYWNLGEEPFVSTDFRGHLQRNERLRLSSTPPNSFSVAQIAGFAKQIRSGKIAETWQDLYRRALVMSVQAEPFVELTVKTEVRPAAGTQQIPTSHFPPEISRVAKLMEKHNKILLTGRSGSGKTTTLRHLAWEFALGTVTIAGREVLPVYVPLKWFGTWPKSKDPPRLSQYVAFWVKETMREHLKMSDLQQCSLFSRQKTRGVTQHRPEDLLNAIEREVGDFFDDGNGDFSRMVFLLDALNEIPEETTQIARKQIGDFVRTVSNIVVSTRSYGAAKTLPQLTRFELAPMSDQEIINYLNICFEGQGEGLFRRTVAADSRILSMARVPFYLELMVRYVRRYPDRTLPTCQGMLLEFSIEEQYGNPERQTVLARRFPGMSESRITLLLTHVACALVDKGQESPSASIPFSDLAGILPAFSIPDIEETTGAAELLGFFEKSGQIGEHFGASGIVSFAHDNIRDFFASLRLKSFMPDRLLQYLPDVAEHYAWDQPLLFFLERSSDKVLNHRIVEFFLPIDPIFAAACLRHAQVVDKVFLLSAVKRIAVSPFAEGLDPGVGGGVSDTLHAMVGAPAVHAIARLPIDQLIWIWQDRSQDPMLKRCAGEAIPLNPTFRDLPALKELWATLYKTPDRNLYIPLASVRSIPTREAFEFVTEAYEQLRTLPSYYGLSDGRILQDLVFGPSPLGSIAYSPSLTEVLARFPPESYPGEFSALLDRVHPTTPQETELVRKLVSNDDLEVARAATQLMVRTVGAQELPALLQRYYSLKEARQKQDKDKDFSYNDRFKRKQLLETLLAAFADWAPDQAASILLAEIEEHKVGPEESLPYWDVNRFTLLQLMVRTGVPQALEYHVEKACADWVWDRDASAFCADWLRAWPDRASTLDAIKGHCHGTELNTQMAKLLATRLGSPEYIGDVEPIFNDLFGRAILDLHPSPPPPPAFEVLFKSNLKSWHLSDQRDALYMLPVALQAATRVPTGPIAGKTLQIITWALDTLCAAGRQIPDRNEGVFESIWRDTGTFQDIVAESLADAIRTFVTFTPMYYSEPQLQGFLTADFLKRFFDLIGEAYPTAGSLVYSEIVVALPTLCKGVPDDYVGLMFSIARQCLEGYLDLSAQGARLPLVDQEWLFDALIRLCRRVGDSEVLDFLKFLDAASEQTQDKKGRLTLASLAEVIKIARGRRFLATFEPGKNAAELRPCP
jgi:hypothetical protein